jgi:hypothetical protein
LAEIVIPPPHPALTQQVFSPHCHAQLTRPVLSFADLAARKKIFLNAGDVGSEG